MNRTSLPRKITVQSGSPDTFRRLIRCSLSLLFILLVTASILIKPSQANAEAGSVDPTLNTGNGPSNTVYAVAVQPSDSKVILGGSFVAYNNFARNRLVRLNNDGSVDTGFNIGSGANGTISAIVIQPGDGKIIIGGAFTKFNGTPINYIARLNPDGTLDSSFAPGTNLNGHVRALALQPGTGKIVIGGDFNTYGATLAGHVARLNPDGSLDTTFNTGTDLNGGVFAVAVQSDGKVIFGGTFTQYKGTTRNYLVRVDTAGALDAGFIDPVITGVVRAITLQPNDSKILVAGDITNCGSSDCSNVIRLNTDGNLDPAFALNVSHTNYVGGVYSVAVDSKSGKILFAGSSFNPGERSYFARVNSDGSFDTSLSAYPNFSRPIYAIAIQPNTDKIILGGEFYNYWGAVPNLLNIGVNYVARLNPDGVLDTNFNSGSGAEDAVRVVAVQPGDGKVIIGGDFISYNGVIRPRFARLNPDGTQDTSFKVGNLYYTNPFSQSPYAIAVQPDGKILVGGEFWGYDAGAPGRIMRLNTDGTLDTSFNLNGSGPNRRVLAMTLQPDGKIVIVGDFYKYNDVDTSYYIARLNPDGSLDTSFNAGAGADGSVYGVAIQPDGKIIVVGWFYKFNNDYNCNCYHVVRLNSDGSLDTSFTVKSDSGISAVYDVIVQPNDSKILIAKGYLSQTEPNRYVVIRLNTDGSLDTSFNSALDNTCTNLTSMALQGDGKILVGGDFVDQSKTGYRCIDRLNPDGRRDTSFTAVELYGNYIAAIQASQGKITVSGKFSAVNKYTRNNLVQLNGEYKDPTSLALTSSANPASLSSTLTFTATITPPGISGQVQFQFSSGETITRNLVNGVATYTTNTLAAGTYTVVAVYSGNAGLSPDQSPVYTQTVSQATTTLSLSSDVNPAQLGQTVKFTALLTPPTAAGLVTFTFNGLTSTTANLSGGVATYITSTLSDTYTVTASYAGNSNYSSSSSAEYTQTISTTPGPQLITATTDDGQATTAGTLSYALATVTSGTITFVLPQGSNTISFSGPLMATLKPGVALDGGANGVILDGNGANGDGLQLGGNNRLLNLAIRHFGGREVFSPAGQTGNRFYRVFISG